MHLARRAWCRTYQTVFRIALPILPYTEPCILEHAEDVPAVLQKRSIQKVLIVTDPGIARLGLTASLERALTAQGIGVTVYAETRANPTVSNVEEAASLYCESACQAIIGFGGGSAMDCAKGVGAHRTAKQAHQQDAWPTAYSSSPAAAYCGSHYRRYGKRSHARGGYHR